MDNTDSESLNWGRLIKNYEDVCKYIDSQCQSSVMTKSVSRMLLSFMSSMLRLWRTLEVPGLYFITWKVLEWLKKVPMYLTFKFQLSWMTKRVLMTLLASMSSMLGLWRTLEVLCLDCIAWKLCEWLKEVPTYLGLKYQPCCMAKRVSRTLLSFMSLLGKFV